MRVDPWDTGVVDLAVCGGCWGRPQTAGRAAASVVAWLIELTPQFRDAVEYVAIDLGEV